MRLGTEKKFSSDVSEAVSVSRALDLALGGGVRLTGLPSLGPLEIVTGESPPVVFGVMPTPKPRLCRALARRTAELISSLKSVMELVRRRELILLGGIMRGSACGR